MQTILTLQETSMMHLLKITAFSDKKIEVSKLSYYTGRWAIFALSGKSLTASCLLQSPTSCFALLRALLA